LKIEAIGKTKIKILLTQGDLEQYGLDYDKLSSENNETRHLIQNLAETAASECGFERRGRQLMVRSLPLKDGGCIMYMSVSEESSHLPCLEKGPFIYSFAETEDMLRAMEALYRAGLSRKADTMLYSGEKGIYYIVLACRFEPNRELDHLLTEFGARHAQGSAAMAHLKEHAKLILPTNAIEAVGEKLVNS
jgi:negative regulator of genetic competence, sporulation and motility